MNRTQILNFLADLWGYQSYLEIGVQFKDWNYNHIRVHNKIGVDPAVPDVDYPITSDDFFQRIPEDKKYDLIFVDGLHVDEQVTRDVLNALDHLSENGRIVCHDCNPESKMWEDTGRNGTVWRAWVRFRMTRPDLHMMCINTDYGCGVIRRGGQDLFPYQEYLDFSILEQNRVQALNLCTPEEFVRVERLLKEISKQPKNSLFIPSLQM